MSPEPGDEIVRAATFAARFIGCFVLLVLGLLALLAGLIGAMIW